MEIVKINLIKSNENNPRIIKDDRFKKLVQSIKEFPEMLKIRPIVVNSEMIVLGGNMRLKACEEAGLKEVPIIKAHELTEEKQKEFIIKDNVGFGEWDWEALANEWDSEELGSWGVDVWQITSDDNGDENVDLSIFKDRSDSYLNNHVRQIVLTFDIEQHKKTLERLSSVQSDYGIVEDNSIALIKLLEFYEDNKSK